MLPLKGDVRFIRHKILLFFTKTPKIKKDIIMSHLNIETRLQIEKALKKGLNVTQIAKLIGKHHTTVSREILKHRRIQNKGNHTRLLNNCVHRFKCHISQLCASSPEGCCSRCDRCRIMSCNDKCKFFQAEVCPTLLKFPFVCNGCNIIHKCTLQKYFYEAEDSQKTYKEVLSESRSGFNLEMSDIKLISEVIADGNKQGQSLYHTLHANKDRLTVPSRTVYRLVNESMLRTKRGDMLMCCCRKSRKHPRHTYKVDSKCLNGRTFEDFMEFTAQNPDIPLVEMDSVIGTPGGKVLMTLLFNNCNLMLAYLREHNTAQSVIDIFNQLEENLGLENFRTLFPVILTDNGSEFSDPEKLEFNTKGERRTKIFYCHPYSSWEKGKIENCHTLLRRILPHGCSFDRLDNDDIALALQHLNSYIRKSLNGKSPAELFSTIYGSKILRQLNIEKAEPQLVIMTPTLLHGKI